jgi:serine/threonine-protein kinase
MSEAHAIADAAEADAGWESGTGIEGRFEVRRVLQSSQLSTALEVLERATGAVQLCKVFAKAAVSAYRRELAAAVQFRHPHVLRLSGTYTLPDGRPCLIYPFARGGTLSDFLTHAQAPPRATTVELLEQMLMGLAHIHAAGWLHCDLKPENMLFDEPAGSATVHLLIGDLGAASTSKEARSGRHAIGTPAYTAPERIYDAFDERADLYSIGVVAFQLLNGRLPYVGTVTEILRGHMGGKPCFDGDENDALIALVRRLLQRNPAHRPQSAVQAIEELAAVRSHFEAPESQLTERSQRLPVLTEVVSSIPLPPPARFTLPHRPARIAVGSRPYLLSVEYPGFSEIFDLVSPGAERMTCLSAGLFSADSNGTLVGLFGEQYCRVDGTARRRDVIASNVVDARAVSVRRDSTVWASGRSVNFVTAGNAIASVRHPSYGALPVIAHWDERVAVTSGLGNEKIEIFDLLGERVDGSLACSGPILAMGEFGMSLFVVSMQLNGGGRYRFELLGEQSAAVALDDVELVSATSGGAVLIVRAETELWHVGTDLVPRLWAELDSPCRRIALSPCGTAAAAVVERENRFEALFIHGPAPADLEIS